MRQLTTLADFVALKRNDKVIVSDQTPEPPKHHTKKHASWANRNYTGYFYGTDQIGRPLYIKIVSKIGSMFVNSYPASGTLSFHVDE